MIMGGFYVNGTAMMTSLSEEYSRFFVASLDAVGWIKDMASSWHGNRSQACSHVFAHTIQSIAHTI